jgi:hypothetical protein
MSYPIPASYGKNEKQFYDDLHNFKYSFIWRALQVLIELKEFRNDEEWIIKRLRFPYHGRIKEGLEGLIRLGYVKKTGTKYEPACGYIKLTDKDVMVQKMHTNWIVAELTEKDKYVAAYIRADRALVAEFAPKFQAVIDELVKAGEDRDCTEVIGMTLAFAQFTKEAGGK